METIMRKISDSKVDSWAVSLRERVFISLFKFTMKACIILCVLVGFMRWSFIKSTITLAVVLASIFLFFMFCSTSEKLCSSVLIFPSSLIREDGIYELRYMLLYEVVSILKVNSSTPQYLSHPVGSCWVQEIWSFSPILICVVIIMGNFGFQ